MVRRHLDYLRRYGRALRAHHVDLTAIVAALGALVLLAATLMRWAEPQTFTSFWLAAYWAVTTITTVGYGDVVPTTTRGQVIAVFTSIVGAGFLVLSAGILAASFVKAMR